MPGNPVLDWTKTGGANEWIALKDTDLFTTDTTELGSNMFAYCENNSANRIDSTGELWGAIPLVIPFIFGGCSSESESNLQPLPYKSADEAAIAFKDQESGVENMVEFLKRMTCFLIIGSICMIHSISNCAEAAMNTTSFAEQIHRDSEMTVYHCSYDTYYAAVQNFSWDYMESHCEQIDVYRQVDINDKPIEKTQLTPNGEQVTRWDDGTARIQNLVVHQTLIAFAGNTEAIQSFLLTKGLMDTVNRAAIITSARLPVVIVVMCEKQTVFVTVDEYFEDYTDDPNSDQYVYRVYSQTEYCQKVLPKKGNVMVAGKAVPSSAIFHCNHIEIPLIAIVESMEGTVVWQNPETVQIKLNGKNYIFDGKEGSLKRKGSKTDILELLPGDTVTWRVEDGEIFLDDQATARVLKEWNASVDVNRETNTVYVNMDRRLPYGGIAIVIGLAVGIGCLIGGILLCLRKR